MPNWLDLYPYSLWCVPGDAIMPCLARWGFVPHAILHVVLFYGSYAMARVAWRRGVRWDTQNFRTAFHVAWHVPNIVTCVPVGLAMFQTAWRLLGEDDAARFGKLDTYKDLAVTECCVWFGTFLAVDTVLITAHRMAEFETFIHHAIFAYICYIMFRGCTAPLVGSALIAQELSTPFLNSFLLLRAYRGLGSVWTQLCFVGFALTFYAFRVCLNTAVTFLYLREAYRGLWLGARSQLLYSTAEQCLLAAALASGWALQIYWGGTITKRLVQAAMGTLSPVPSPSPTRRAEQDAKPKAA